MAALLARYTVALDLGKQAHVAHIYDTATGQRSKPVRVLVTALGFAGLDRILATYSANPADFLVGCEATGHYGETIVRYLHARGYEVVLLNPRQSKQFRLGLGHRAKTDSLDAEALARQLAVGVFPALTPVSATRQALRRLTHLRADLVTEQTRWLNRLRGVLDQICPELSCLLPDLTTATALALLEQYPSRRALAQAHLPEMTAVVSQASRGQKGEAFAQQIQRTAQQSVGVDDPWLETELRIVLGHIRAMRAAITELDREIACLTQAILQEISVLLHLPGTMTLDMFPCKGPLMLGTLLAEIGDVRRFPTGRHLLSYLGWCPYARQSGTKTATHQKMSHAGSRHARHMLWMMAISAVQNVAEYRAYFQVRVAAGKSKMKTLIAVGRKLLGVIYTILKTGVPYDPQRYLQHQATRAT